jgi:diacylglycerol kinase family enzyme
MWFDEPASALAISAWAELANDARRTATSDAVPRYRARVRAVAIVNGNARGLRGRLRAKLERAAPGRVRFTSSLDNAREVIRQEIALGCDLIVLGGGDGTVVMGLTLIGEACRGSGRPEPAVGVLRLGSGNAIADAVGATDEPAADLADLIRGRARWRSVPLVEVLGVRAPFVGMGVDALLLEDNERVGHAVDRVPGGRFIGGAARYALSVATRSIPRFATTQRPIATVTNLGSPALEMTQSGPSGLTIPSGAVIWKGAVTLVAAGTIPFFGFGLRMFAFANSRADRFHLRCGDPGLMEILRNLPRAFRGEYFSEKVSDFLCDRVQIDVDQETVVEAGGELLGRHSQVELVLGRPATLATLAKDP